MGYLKLRKAKYAGFQAPMCCKNYQHIMDMRDFEADRGDIKFEGNSSSGVAKNRIRKGSKKHENINHL
mgnify:CR=1 FL=1